MPETGSQILSYQGNAGLGSNASIPAINPKADLDVINQIGRDILMINHDNNIRLYDQKVKDRDATLQMIVDGQVAAGKIDPSDRKYYDEAKKKATDDFYEMIKNGGLNNTDAVRKYRESVTDLKNVATWAQHREIGLTALETEKAAQTLPKDIAMYDKHIQKMRGQPFWNQVNPLQKAFKYDINSSIAKVTGQPITESEIGTMSGAGSPMGVTQWNSVTKKGDVVTEKTTQKISPLRNAQITAPRGKGITTTGTQVNSDGTLSEISYTPEKYWDLETIQQNVSELSASNPEDNYTYHEWLNDVETKLPEDRKLALLIADNNQLAKYSIQRGIEPIGTNPDGSPIYAAQVQYFSDPISGKTHIRETPESFFAKHSLASIKGDYVEKPQAIFNKDIAAYKVNKQKADTDEFYKHAMAGAANKKANAYAANLNQQMRFRKTAQEQDNFLNEIWQRNLTQQPKLLEGSTTRGIVPSNIEADNSLPVFTLTGKEAVQLQPIGSTAVFDKYYTDAKGVKTPLNGAKFLYWEGGHYEPQYILNGKLQNGQNLSELYINFVGQANKNFKKGIAEEWKGTPDDFIKEAVKSNFLEYRLKGANGTTDRELSNAAQRIISNAATKKGQTAVFNTDDQQPPLDDTIIEESSSSSSNSNSKE